MGVSGNYTAVGHCSRHYNYNIIVIRLVTNLPRDFWLISKIYMHGYAINQVWLILEYAYVAHTYALINI